MQIDVVRAAVGPPDRTLRDLQPEESIEGERSVDVARDEIQLVEHRFLVSH
jgi:hypothetical protein